MRGVGGPLLSIGDLLSDVGEVGSVAGNHQEANPLSSSSSSSISNPSDDVLPPSHLTQLFQENYNQLSEALAGTDHSWTALTLKLCTALETADKLVQSADSNVGLLSEKVGVLETIVKRGDSAVKAAKSIHDSHITERAKFYHHTTEERRLREEEVRREEEISSNLQQQEFGASLLPNNGGVSTNKGEKGGEQFSLFLHSISKG